MFKLKFAVRFIFNSKYSVKLIFTFKNEVKLIFSFEINGQSHIIDLKYVLLLIFHAN